MVTDDLDCDAAATELTNRQRDEEIATAHLRSTLPAMQAIATALSRVADQRTSKPRRRSRTIRAVYDDDGVAIGTEDIEPVPVNADVGEAPPIEEEPAPGGFADVFGSIEADHG